MTIGISKKKYKVQNKTAIRSYGKNPSIFTLKINE